MPRIKNWSVATKECGKGFDYGWKNSETEELVCMTSKVPNDGYYGMKFNSHEKPERGKGERVAFESHKIPAKKSIVSELRKNPDGF